MLPSPSEITLVVALYAIAITLVSLLVLWLVIFTAVRAALRSHQRATEGDRRWREALHQGRQ